MLTLVALDAVGAAVGFASVLLFVVAVESGLLTAVGGMALSVFSVGVGVADAQAARAIMLMATIMLKVFFRFICFLHS